MFPSDWPEGTVLIRVMAGTDGVPRDLEVVQSPGPAFREPALAAVRQWRYEPGRLRGMPIDLPALAEVQFRRPNAPPSTSETASRREERETPRNPVVEHPKLLHELEPDYPAALIGSGIEGTVLIRMLIGIDGVPQTFSVVRTSGPEFTESALAAAKEWRYEPGNVPVQLEMEKAFSR